METRKHIVSFACEILSDIKPVVGIDSVIFDIDDTLIDQFGNPMFDVIYLYLQAKTLGFKIFIITARSGREENISRTLPFSTCNKTRHFLREKKKRFLTYNID